jgi:hypothetical protein
MMSQRAADGKLTMKNIVNDPGSTCFYNELSVLSVLMRFSKVLNNAARWNGIVGSTLDYGKSPYVGRGNLCAIYYDGTGNAAAPRVGAMELLREKRFGE